MSITLSEIKNYFTKNNLTGNSNAGGTLPYLVYTALLTQSGTDAPVATVLDNTLGGTVVWTYDSVGFYIGTLAGAFINGKIFPILSNNYSPTRFYAFGVNEAPNSVFIDVRQFNIGNIESADGQLQNTPIEIRVYP